MEKAFHKCSSVVSGISDEANDEITLLKKSESGVVSVMELLD